MGPLIVYLHGSPSSRLDVDYLAARSRRRGARVVGIDRPGYGGSTFVRFDAASIADDVIAVADALGAKQFAVIGQSSGSAYAWATAALHPDRVTAVATGGGDVPFEPGTSRWGRLSEAEQKGVSLIGTDDVEAERLLAQPDLPFMDLLKLSDGELELAWKNEVGSADKRTMANGFGAVIVKTMRESLRQGQVGWARDNVVRMGPWRFDHGAIKCPATQWYGEQEEQALENAAWVTARLPSVLTRIVPDRGHFVIFDDWDDVMDFLLR